MPPLTATETVEGGFMRSDRSTFILQLFEIVIHFILYISIDIFLFLLYSGTTFCGCRITAITPAFQAGDEGSTPFIR